MTRTDISIISVNGKTPRIDPSAFIAPGCRIIGVSLDDIDADGFFALLTERLGRL